MSKTRTARHYTAPTPGAVLHKEPKPIILEIVGDTIIFRHKGERQRYSLSITEAFREAVLRNA